MNLFLFLILIFFIDLKYGAFLPLRIAFRNFFILLVVTFPVNLNFLV